MQIESEGVSGLTLVFRVDPAYTEKLEEPKKVRPQDLEQVIGRLHK